MNKGIFREYDIRGVAGVDILDEDVKNIGKAYGTLLHHEGRHRVSVGRDCRLSSGELADALSRVLGDPELRSRLAQGGRRGAAEHSWPAIAARTESALGRFAKD